MSRCFWVSAILFVFIYTDTHHWHSVLVTVVVAVCWPSFHTLFEVTLHSDYVVVHDRVTQSLCYVMVHFTQSVLLFAGEFDLYIVVGHCIYLTLACSEAASLTRVTVYNLWTCLHDRHSVCDTQVCVIDSDIHLAFDIFSFVFSVNCLIKICTKMLDSGWVSVSSM